MACGLDIPHYWFKKKRYKLRNMNSTSYLNNYDSIVRDWCIVIEDSLKPLKAKEICSQVKTGEVCSKYKDEPSAVVLTWVSILFLSNGKQPHGSIVFTQQQRWLIEDQRINGHDPFLIMATNSDFILWGIFVKGMTKFWF